MLDPLTWSRAHLEVPFTPHGRDRRGWDCWGLVRCAYADLYDIDLPGYDEAYAGTTARDREVLANAIAIHREGSWSRTERPQPGDVAVMWRCGRPMHVGLVVDGDHRAWLVCHTERGVGTAIERVEPKDEQIEGVYRYGA